MEAMYVVYMRFILFVEVCKNMPLPSLWPDLALPLQECQRRKPMADRAINKHQHASLKFSSAHRPSASQDVAPSSPR
jgi:hypothetical protein